MTEYERRQEEKRKDENARRAEQSLKAQEKANEIHKEQLKAQEKANEIHKEQLNALQTANEIAARSIANQETYYSEQIEIDSQMLALAKERAMREQNVTFCNWCGRTIPNEQATDYLDIKTCSLRCKEDYRKYIIEKNLLISCNCCNADLLEKIAIKDYEDVEIAQIAHPCDQAKKIPLTYGDIAVLEEDEAQNAIKTYCEQFSCCQPECLTALLAKDEKIKNYCGNLSASFEKYLTYEIAVNKIDENDFDTAEELFNRIPQYKDAAQKSEFCRSLIDRYNALREDFFTRFTAIESEFNRIKEQAEVMHSWKYYKDSFFALKEQIDHLIPEFSNAVPEEHRKYKPIAEMFSTIEETKSAMGEIENEIFNSSSLTPGCIITIIMTVILAIILMACMAS